MKSVASGQKITCQGQDLLVACVYGSSDINIGVYNAAGTLVPLTPISESKAFTLPGNAGVQYEFTFSSGSVDVSGTSLIN
jgi:hypothetical protein